MNQYLRTWALDDIHIQRSGDGRTVVAYAAMFDSPYEVRDVHGHYMEVIDRSAFNRTLNNGGARKVACLYNHGLTVYGTPDAKLSIPLGTPLEIKPDGRGLLTVTRYNRGEVADLVLESIRNGDIRSQSFRGNVYRSSPSRVPRVMRGGPLPTVTRNELGLSDYGPTPTAINSTAHIVAVRSLVQLAADIEHLDDLDEDAREELLEELARHLPGKHRQGSHGNRFSTPGDRASGLLKKGKSRVPDAFDDDDDDDDEGQVDETPAAPEPEAPKGVSERSKKAYDSLLGADGTGGTVANKSMRQIVEQLEAHGWEITSHDPMLRVTTFKAPDGRKLGVQFLNDKKPRIFDDPAGRGGRDLTFKAALAHVVTPKVDEVSGPNVFEAVKRVDPNLQKPLDDAMGFGQSFGPRDSTLEPFVRAIRQLSGYGGTTQRPHTEVVADLRQEAERNRKLAADIVEYNRKIGGGEDSRSQLLRQRADQFERVAVEMERMAKERSAFEKERDRRASQPLDIRPGRSRRKADATAARSETFDLFAPDEGLEDDNTATSAPAEPGAEDSPRVGHSGRLTIRRNRIRAEMISLGVIKP